MAEAAALDAETRARGTVRIGISEYAVSDDPKDVLVTYSLGSCIGVTAFDPERGVGGLIHCLLPMGKIDPERARSCPAMFVDTGVVKLLQELSERGARFERLVVKVAGAGNIMDESQSFKIGKRNHAVLQKLLWKNDILVAAEDVGGTKSRTLRLDIATGRTTVSRADGIREL